MPDVVSVGDLGPARLGGGAVEDSAGSAGRQFGFMVGVAFWGNRALAVSGFVVRAMTSFEALAASLLRCFASFFLRVSLGGLALYPCSRHDSGPDAGEN